jgi:hypothetical protein
VQNGRKGAVVTCNELTSHISYFLSWKAVHFAVLQDLCDYWRQFNPVVSLNVVPDSWMIRRWVYSQGISLLSLYGSRSSCAHPTPLYRFLSAGYAMGIKHSWRTLLSSIGLCSVMKSHLVLSDFDSVNTNFKSNLKINL